ncbi:CoA pyrophosphatase [Flavobacterium sp. ASW18X]|uniref:NUDIX hydrolase n=1 Tax=Flavobacterium sp. ASW18X TaxID=2572595 RepID=UPI0010AE4E55|nr:CoA pyrophosphatase [Flavobacterium sp. ASW18X]TKD57486.1 CoA pyrophosphatase [Flavobacterium sp. ASW18X]
MNFTDFREQVVKIKNLDLPADASHAKMEPEVRKKVRQMQQAKLKDARKAAVMALFYPNQEGQTHLLLILRKTYKGVHSNQIGFPGGKVEPTDANLLATALRETEEEVGVNPKDVQLIRPLSKIYIPPSNFLVQPYLGLYGKPKPFVKDAYEVEDLIEVTLVDFINDSNLIQEKMNTSYGSDIRVPAFKLNGYTVWGATAMMLSEIKDLLKQVV